MIFFDQVFFSAFRQLTSLFDIFPNYAYLQNYFRECHISKQCLARGMKSIKIFPWNYIRLTYVLRVNVSHASLYFVTNFTSLGGGLFSISLFKDTHFLINIYVTIKVPIKMNKHPVV